MASIIIIIIVFVIDVLAFTLAIGAEHRRSKAELTSTDNGNTNYCKYGSDAATAYGVSALLLLMASQVVVMAMTKCFCCGRALPPGRWRANAGICFIACWFTFIIAELCLLAASVRNAYHTNTKYTQLISNPPPACTTMRKGVFAAGAAFVFLTALLTELHYIFYSKAREVAGVPSPMPNDRGIGMTRM